MTENIQQILIRGEGERSEFKSSFNAGVVETLVAFANTHGGAVYIGISDSGEVKGAQLSAESVQSWINEIKSKTIPSIIPDYDISTPRNKLIADLFKEAGMIEKYGTGIKRVFAAVKEAGLPAPEFKEIAEGILVTIYSSEAGIISEKTVEKTVEKILVLIKQNPFITQKELADSTGLTQRGVEWNIQKLKNEGLVRRVGPDKGGKWEIT